MGVRGCGQWAARGQPEVLPAPQTDRQRRAGAARGGGGGGTRWRGRHGVGAVQDAVTISLHSPSSSPSRGDGSGPASDVTPSRTGTNGVL